MKRKFCGDDLDICNMPASSPSVEECKTVPPSNVKVFDFNESNKLIQEQTQCNALSDFLPALDVDSNLTCNSSGHLVDPRPVKKLREAMLSILLLSNLGHNL